MYQSYLTDKIKKYFFTKNVRNIVLPLFADNNFYRDFVTLNILLPNFLSPVAYFVGILSLPKIDSRVLYQLSSIAVALWMYRESDNLSLQCAQ